MRRLALALAVVLPLLALVSTAPADGATTGARALWVWTRPAARTLVAFAAKQHVSALFVSVPTGVDTSADLPWLRSVVTQAHAGGITVDALGGDPGWATDPAAALAWQRSAVATGLFDGIHVDLEPWVRSDWDSNRAAVVAGYVDVLGQLADATSLPVEADLAFWLWTVPTSDGTPLDAAVMRTVDRATVLSYRNTATGTDSITDVGAHELATAAAAGIRCRLAVETNYLGPDPVSRKQTFAGMRASALTSAMAAVDRAEAGVASYAGIAVEDYDGWRALR